jgi:hypothetical protein
MDFIEIKGEQKPFRFGLRALKRLEADFGVDKFQNIIQGVQLGFGDTVNLAELVLYIGLSEGARAAGEKNAINKKSAEDLIDEGGMPFMEKVMEKFEKTVSSPK